MMKKKKKKNQLHQVKMGKIGYVSLTLLFKHQKQNETKEKLSIIKYKRSQYN